MEALSKVGKYDVMDVLGRGGMGVVYKAMDPKIGRLVAIKMMTVGFTENPDLLKRFYREAQSTGTLQHPNIVIVYELGDQDGNPYLVMEYLEGESLDRIITARRQLTLVQRLDVIIQICNALNYAHSKGVVHRDIKPANVVILKDGSVKIVDFGIARIGGDALTRTGQVVGTINYMSPEQIQAQVVDGRSDIWAAGVLAFQLLTFALPFDANDTPAVLLKIIGEDPPSLSSYMSDCPPELEQAVRHALVKDREERYQTAEDFAFDLMRVREKQCREQVDQYLEQAQQAVARSELAKGKELLLEILKVDTQNMAAKQLLQQVQQLMQKQQRGEQVRQLHDMARAAIEQKQFQDAIGYLDQALAVDKMNSELRNLREWAQQAQQRQQRVEEILQQAESAQQADDLDQAQALLAEAMKLDANDSRVRSLHAALNRDIEIRSRRNKLQGMLSSAAKEISSRRFTAALDLLKEVETIDATAPELHALLKLAQAGHDQEQRRRELEDFSAHIEEAMGRDDYAGACSKAEEALLKFPNDPALIKLRTLAEKQRHASERKQFVEEQLAAARVFLDAGRSAEAVQVLEAALKKTPGDTRLHSMLGLLRENVERETVEQQRQQVVRSAKEALRAKAFDKAVEILEDALNDLGDSPEISDLLQFARDEVAGAELRKRVNDAAEEAQRLMAADEHEQAVALLEDTLQETPDDALRVILAEARRQVEDFNKKLAAVITRAQRLIDTHKASEAVQLLSSQPASFSRSPAFLELSARARTEHERAQRIQKALEEAREAHARNDTSTAISILQRCRDTNGDAPELTKALSEIEGKRSAAAKAAIDRAIRDGRMLLLARQYTAALQMLESVQQQASSAPAELKAQYDKLLNEIRTGAARQQADVSKASRAVTQDGAVPSGTQVDQSYGSTTVGHGPAMAGSSGTIIAPAPGREARAAAAPAIAPARVAEVAPAARSRKTGLIVAVVVVVLLLAAGAGYFMTHRAAPTPSDSYISFNAVPWGTVKSLEPVGGKSPSILVNQVTPLRLSVPAGEYKVTISGPDGTNRTEQVRVSTEAPVSLTVVFEAIDVDKIINSH